MVVASNCGGGMRSSLMRTEFKKIELFWRWTVMRVTQHLSGLNVTELYH
jgi:hypothetical protein